MQLATWVQAPEQQERLFSCLFSFRFHFVFVSGICFHLLHNRDHNRVLIISWPWPLSAPLSCELLLPCLEHQVQQQLLPISCRWRGFLSFLVFHFAARKMQILLNKHYEDLAWSAGNGQRCSCLKLHLVCFVHDNAPPCPCPCPCPWRCPPARLPACLSVAGHVAVILCAAAAASVSWHCSCHQLQLQPHFLFSFCPWLCGFAILLPLTSASSLRACASYLHWNLLRAQLLFINPYPQRLAHFPFN